MLSRFDSGFRLANLESITLADTAPTDAALENDFLVIKQLGFNAFRVHMKVESRRFYHHADRLGIMILQDMPRSAMVTGRSENWFGL